MNRLYVLNKEGRRGFDKIEDCIDALIQGFENYNKKSNERRIEAARNRMLRIKLTKSERSKKRKFTNT